MRQGKRFSERFGLVGVEPGNALVDAPKTLRSAILDVACECGVQLGVLRAVLRLEFRKPSQGGVSGADLWEESKALIQQSSWPGVYDAAEALYELVARDDPERGVRFEIELNRLFRSEQVPFEMTQGQIFPMHGFPIAGEAIALPRGPPSVSPVTVEPTPGAGEVNLDSVIGRAVSRPPLLTAVRTVVDWLIGTAERPGFKTLTRGIAGLLRLFFGNGVLK